VSIEQLVGAALLTGVLLGGFAGFWLRDLAQTKEVEMTYRDLHRHVHHRLGLKPPKKET
jgi:hypothetical protein